MGKPGRGRLAAALGVPAALIALLLPASAAAEPILAASVQSRWTGDLDGMIERRRIRVLVVDSKTFYFVDRGRQRGATYDLARAFEDDLNRRLRTGHLKVHVMFIPVSRDELIPGLLSGRGDIAAANLTITDERRARVDFSAPLATGVAEVVVTGPASPPAGRPMARRFSRPSGRPSRHPAPTRQPATNSRISPALCGPRDDDLGAAYTTFSSSSTSAP
jgi:hypothetical protein